MTARVYVAASVEMHQDAAVAARVLRAKGAQVTSRWHDRPLDWTKDRREVANNNRADLRAANAVLCLPHPACRGTLWELGFAYACGHRLVVVGLPDALTLMADQPGVLWALTLDAAWEALGGEWSPYSRMGAQA